MATLTIRFAGELGSLSAESLILVLDESLSVLKDLDHRISEQRFFTVKWVVSGLREQAPAIVLESRTIRGLIDHAPRIRESFTRGVSTIETQGSTPPFFSTENVNAVGRIVQQFAKNGMHAVAFESDEGTAPANLTPDAAPKIARLTGITYHALGSIEGRVQLVSVNPRYRHFNITHSRTLKTVRCNFPLNVEDSVFDAIKTRRKVIVSGRIAYNAQHEPVSISLSPKDIRFLKEEDELPTIEELVGSAPNITGELSTAEFLKELRDG